MLKLSTLFVGCFAASAAAPVDKIDSSRRLNSLKTQCQTIVSSLEPQLGALSDSSCSSTGSAFLTTFEALDSLVDNCDLAEEKAMWSSISGCADITTAMSAYCNKIACCYDNSCSSSGGSSDSSSSDAASPASPSSPSSESSSPSPPALPDSVVEIILKAAGSKSDYTYSKKSTIKAAFMAGLAGMGISGATITVIVNDLTSRRQLHSLVPSLQTGDMLQTATLQTAMDKLFAHVIQLRTDFRKSTATRRLSEAGVEIAVQIDTPTGTDVGQVKSNFAMPEIGDQMTTLLAISGITVTEMAVTGAGGGSGGVIVAIISVIVVVGLLVGFYFWKKKKATVSSTK